MNVLRCVLGGLVAAFGLCGCSSSDKSPNAASGGSAGAFLGSGGIGVGAGGFSAGGGSAGGASSGGASTGGASAGGAESADAGWIKPLNDRPDLFSGPPLLSQTGLYTDIAHGVLATDLQHYVPAYQLWSDGATKERWLKLPPTNNTIDTSNMDDWIFPVGTKVFKQFTRDGKRVETRMVWKAAADQWQMVAYIWNPQQTEAYAAPEGQDNASGTLHDVPDATKCPTCHNGRSDRLLGVSALQLSRTPVAPTDATIDSLKQANLLTVAPAAALKLPGDQATQDALGYLHANCGQCHNTKSQVAAADRNITVYFWENTDELATLEGTAAYKSLVGKNSPLWINAVTDRMGVRDSRTQMPPLATEDVDTVGVAQVKVLMDLLRQKVPALPTPAVHGSCVLPDAIKQSLVTNCGASFCHGSQNDAQGELRISALQTDQELTDLLVATPAASDLSCSKVGISRVEPGHPERSLLWLKLQPGPPCGNVMPPALTVPQDQIDAIKTWITNCTPTP